MTGTPQHETPHEPTHDGPQDAPQGGPRRTRTQLALLVAGTLVVGLGLGAFGGATARSSAAGGAPETAAPAADLGRPLPGTSAADAKLSSWWGFGAQHRTFTGQGLSQAGGSAHVWAFDAASAIDPTAVARAARALGLASEPTAQWGSWLVGATDGSGPSMSVGGDGQATLSYTDPSTWCRSDGDATVMPVEPATGTVEGSSGSSGAAADGSVAASPCPTTGLGSDDAIARTRDLLAAVGVQLGDARLTASGSDASTWVQADQVVEGSPTGVTWTVGFVGEQVQSVLGPLAPVVDLGEYALLSPADAVARLSDPRFTGTAPVMAMDAPTKRTVPQDPATLEQAATPTPGAAASPTAAAPSTPAGAPSLPEASTVPAIPTGPAETAAPTAAPVPAAGAPLGWGVQQVVLVASSLTVSVTTLGDGSVVLLPTYVLTDADGGTWQVAAVSDAGLGLS
ncbi:MAG: hypothetical protein L6311_10785 [Cellulomonas sp.]|nr:hypothetical protein [Cellulomonas sp.]